MVCKPCCSQAAPVLCGCNKLQQGQVRQLGSNCTNGLWDTIGVILPQMEQTEQLMPQLHRVLLTRREQRLFKHDVQPLQILGYQCRGYARICSETNDVRFNSPALCGRAAAARVRWARRQPNVTRKDAARKLSAAAQHDFRSPLSSLQVLARSAQAARASSARAASACKAGSIL